MGLFATDGCLYNDGRHLDFTSKDKEQITNFKKCFGLKIGVSYKTSGYSRKLCPRLQFGDVILYSFFTSIGLTPNKSKTIGKLMIPKKYFFDFLRGHHDGDGSFYSYWDPRWKSSFMYYLVFISASRMHVEWLRESLEMILGVRGHVTGAGKKGTAYQLKYAKREARSILRKMYYKKNITCLSRKRLKIERALGIVGQSL